MTDGFVDDLLAWTGAGGDALSALLDERFTIEGVSTHISVTVDNELAPRAAGMFSRTFAPALMLLMDADTSPGLLVRPRFGRLEFGGEFVTGDQLGAAVALAAGAAVVCETAAASFRKKSLLPPPVRVDVVRAVDRFGWYVGRDAFGLDLYRAGRATVLKRELLGRITGQRCLAESWKSARTAIEATVSERDLRAADDAVTGRLDLPLESGLMSSPPVPRRAPEAPPIGRAMAEIETPRHALHAVAATWDFVVFRASGDPGAYVSVPTDGLDGFLGDARDGRHDERLASVAAGTNPGRTLTTFGDASTFDFWPSFEYGAALAAPERGADGIERGAAS